jgi:hypothetical protein
MPESQLRQRIRKALQRAFPGALVIGWPGNFWSGAGWPDLLFLDWPLLLGLEVKQGRRSKPTPVQGARHSLLRAHHVPVYVVHTPSEACDAITELKGKLPMAFDPKLQAELEAALLAGPAEPDLNDAPASVAANDALADIDLDVSAPVDTSDNGTVTLDADAPAPDIEDITAAILQSEEIAQEQADEALALAGAEVDILVALKRSIDELTVAIVALSVMLADEAPKPRGRARRAQ